MKNKLMKLYERTLNNCYFYEKEKDVAHLLNEIGCLRGIAYSLEEAGINPFSLSGLEHFIDISNRLLMNT